MATLSTPFMKARTISPLPQNRSGVPSKLSLSPVRRQQPWASQPSALSTRNGADYVLVDDGVATDGECQPP
jgi:hypothetical protein